MSYFIYVLKSCVSKRFYIGCTSDLQKRLLSHNQGKTKSTKPYKPWELVYSEKFESKTEAFKREWHLKHPKGYLDKLEIIKAIRRGRIVA